MGALMLVDEQTLMESLCDVWPEAVDGLLIPNHCIVAARTAIEVGSYFGHTWQAIPVDIIVANAAGTELIRAKVPPAEWPDEAWSVGCNCDAAPEPGRFPGHLIAGSPTRLIDLSAAQFSRPHKRIEMEPWVIDRTDENGPWDASNGEVHLGLWPRWDHSEYRDAPDWRHWKRKYQALAAELIRRLKEAA